MYSVICMLEALEMIIVYRLTERLGFFRKRCKSGRDDSVTTVKLNETGICFYRC